MHKHTYQVQEYLKKQSQKSEPHILRKQAPTGQQPTGQQQTPSQQKQQPATGSKKGQTGVRWGLFPIAGTIKFFEDSVRQILKDLNIETMVNSIPQEISNSLKASASIRPRDVLGAIVTSPQLIRLLQTLRDLIERKYMEEKSRRERGEQPRQSPIITVTKPRAMEPPPPIAVKITPEDITKLVSTNLAPTAVGVPDVVRQLIDNIINNLQQTITLLETEILSSKEKEEIITKFNEWRNDFLKKPRVVLERLISNFLIIMRRNTGKHIPPSAYAISNLVNNDWWYRGFLQTVLNTIANERRDFITQIINQFRTQIESRIKPSLQYTISTFISRAVTESIQTAMGEIENASDLLRDDKWRAFVDRVYDEIKKRINSSSSLQDIPQQIASTLTEIVQKQQQKIREQRRRIQELIQQQALPEDAIQTIEEEILEEVAKILFAPWSGKQRTTITGRAQAQRGEVSPTTTGGLSYLQQLAQQIKKLGGFEWDNRNARSTAISALRDLLSELSKQQEIDKRNVVTYAARLNTLAVSIGKADASEFSTLLQDIINLSNTLQDAQLRQDITEALQTFKQSFDAVNNIPQGRVGAYAKGKIEDPWKAMRSMKFQYKQPKQVTTILLWLNRLTDKERAHIMQYLYRYWLAIDKDEKKKALQDLVRAARSLGLPVN